MEALPRPRCVWPQAEKKSVEAEIEERPVETADENVSISGSLSSARPLPVLPTMNPVGGENLNHVWTKQTATQQETDHEKREALLRTKGHTGLRRNTTSCGLNPGKTNPSVRF